MAAETVPSLVLPILVEAMAGLRVWPSAGHWAVDRLLGDGECVGTPAGALLGDNDEDDGLADGLLLGLAGIRHELIIAAGDWQHRNISRAGGSSTLAVKL